MYNILVPMIKDNIVDIRRRISSLCSVLRREPFAITLVCVTKGRDISKIREVIDSGVFDIGENRVQEALLKYSDKRLAVNDKPIRWHMVGHLQSNKVREAVRIFDLIHSVDSLSLAKEINKQAERINKIQDILIQVNTSGEVSKFGIKPQEAGAVIEGALKLKNINIKGLMTIAPLADNPEDSRLCFRQLRGLRDKIHELRIANYAMPAGRQELQILSMGMSNDFEVAIEEGSTMIRLGRAIFEGIA